MESTHDTTASASENAAHEADTTTTASTDTATTTATAPGEEMVSRSEFQRVVEDMNRYKKAAIEFEQKVKAKEIDSLKAQNQWEQIAKLKEEEAREAKEAELRLREAIVFEKKYAAIREQAIQAGLRREAIPDLELVDFDDVTIETTSTGRINVLNADRAVQRLKTLKPHWFSATRPSVNATSPDVTTSGKISYDDLKKAEAEAKKSGNYANYRDLLFKFRAQM